MSLVSESEILLLIGQSLLFYLIICFQSWLIIFSIYLYKVVMCDLMSYSQFPRGSRKRRFKNSPELYQPVENHYKIMLIWIFWKYFKKYIYNLKRLSRFLDGIFIFTLPRGPKRRGDILMHAKPSINYAFLVNKT